MKHYRISKLAALAALGAVVFTTGWLTGAERARACPGFPAHTGGLGDCSSIELGLGVSPANSGADHFSLTCPPSSKNPNA